ncbi:MAG: hypothetical protein HPY85_14015 [Anaerolineae bacterium]|nr:hypothetical protein [Anaerolineae bacterium]
MKNIAVLGPGQVGQALLLQLLEHLAKDDTIQLTAVADSTGLLLDMNGLAPSLIRQVITTKSQHLPLHTMEGCACLDLLPQCFGNDTVLVDTSAAETTIDILLAGLDAGCAVAMANKKNLTQAWERSAPFFNNQRVRFESTVCAAVPVMSAISRLVKANDTVQEIQGSLSGTLGFICAQFDMEIPYSEAVLSAHQLGFTEPDPRDDLGGIDVGRKALILARANGWPLEMKDIRIEPMYSDDLARLSPPEFLEQCNNMDEIFTMRQEQARAEGKVLRYIAHVNPHGGEARLIAVPAQSEFGSLRGSGNRVVIHSRHHRENPLVISGSGAGAALTASGVLADIRELINL